MLTLSLFTSWQLLEHTSMWRQFQHTDTQHNRCLYADFSKKLVFKFELYFDEVQHNTQQSVANSARSLMAPRNYTIIFIIPWWLALYVELWPQWSNTAIWKSSTQATMSEPQVLLIRSCSPQYIDKQMQQNSIVFNGVTTPR